MYQSKTFAALALAGALGLGACSGLNHQERRAVTGGAIGAGGGALVGALTGGSALTGALIGGGAGAAIGALTADDDDYKRRR
ncbi:hypothetical protein D3874_12180 [Oleomonas cavernae]|uniref:YMGG-like Gly-zipper domain-containing protein n=1 Tax=Oleomonas cavernae TaxID=2320859 RepID=A0A418WCH2_9PROT|nr:YMGG-like glycine zipper-containing protein [Oleomonas cavernae]RJF87684.1 hypothetical protein D3874_12180 [Oleomonas cavernae]